MPHAENSVVIERPINDVFEYLADGANNLYWRSGVREIERVTAETGRGAVYRQVLAGPGGRRIRGDYRVTVHDAPHALGFAVIAGPARPTGRFTLTEEGPGRTGVTFALDLRPTGLARLMGGMIARQMRAEVAQLEHLKANLER